MIIDSQVLTQLAVGTDKITPQQGDSQVLVPPVLTGVVQPRLPWTPTGTGTGVTATQSLLWSASFTRNNQAAGPGATLCVLPKGLYELYISLAARFDYTLTGAVPDVELEIVSGTFAEDLLALYAAVGAQSIRQTHRILLLAQATIRLSFGATTVAQNLDVTAMVNAQRIL